MTHLPKACADMTDAALLQAYATGDNRAAAALTDRLLPRVLGQAMRMLGDRAQAEDVAQEAMLRLWKAAPDWQEGRAQVATWTYRVVANLCIDRLRARRRFVRWPVWLDPSDPTPPVSTQMQTQARHTALADALAALPDRQAQAVALRYLEGLSNPQIADVMQISVRAVESLTARGKRGLAAHLGQRKEELGFADD